MSDVAASPPLLSEELPAAQAHSSRGVVLGAAMGVGNILSYCFVLVLTHAFGPASFGAYSALNTIGIVLVIPAGAFQVIIAGRWNDTQARTNGLIAACSTGVGLTALTALGSPVLVDLLHLSGPAPALAMSAMLLPMTVTGAFQGILLGAGELGKLACLYLLTAATRLIAAIVCAVLGVGVTYVFLATAAASLVTALYGWWAARSLLHVSRAHSATLLQDMVRSNITLAAFTALTNVDVILVRHFLDAHTSGGYGLASTFGRAMCWGTQFIALLVVPRLHHQGQGVLWRAAGIITAIGLLATSIVALSAGRLVALVGGANYTTYGSLVVACLALGTLWALAQLLLFSEMAGKSALLGGLTWLMVGLELGLGWTTVHHSAYAIIALAAGCSGAVVIAGGVRLLRTSHQRTLA